jgi:hypothetical protein
VLFAELVLRRIGIRIAALPEALDEGVALFVVAQAHERLALFVADDVGNLIVQPGLVCALQLLPQSLLRRGTLLQRALALERVRFLVLILCGSGLSLLLGRGG